MSIRVWSSVLVLLFFALPFEAQAQKGDCSGWLPDFNCEREARFAGFSAPVTAPFVFEDPFVWSAIP